MRKAQQLIQKAPLVPWSKDFHHTSLTLAKAAPRRSPRVTSGSSQTQSKIRVQKTYSIDDSLPPYSLLKTAEQSGALDIQPEKVIVFLQQYQQLPKRDGGFEQKLCVGMLFC